MDRYRERRQILNDIPPRVGLRPSPEELALLYEERADKARARQLTDDMNGEPIAPRYEHMAHELSGNLGNIVIRKVESESQIPVQIAHPDGPHETV
jgi:hypothetical protein